MSTVKGPLIRRILRVDHIIPYYTNIYTYICIYTWGSCSNHVQGLYTGYVGSKLLSLYDMKPSMHDS